MGKHSNFKSFGKAIKKNAVDIEKEIERKIGNAALAGLSAASFVTPVKTGRARGNWHLQSSLDTSTTYQLEAPSGISISAASSYKIGKIIYLVNNLEYIVHLDDGSSLQAPSGITPAVISAIKTELRR